MWIKRTEIEMTEEQQRRRRSHVRGAVIFGLFVATFTTVSFGWREAGDRHRLVVPTKEILHRLPGSIVFGAIAAVLIYKITGKRRIMICPKCETSKHDDGVLNCSCGGHFENIEEMKHVA